MKKVQSKVEEAKIQITEEQLKTIKQQQQDLTQILKDIGFLEAQKHALNHKYALLAQDVEEFKVKLEKEYGAVNNSLEDGVCTPIDKKGE